MLSNVNALNISIIRIVQLKRITKYRQPQLILAIKRLNKYQNHNFILSIYFNDKDINKYK